MAQDHDPNRPQTQAAHEAPQRGPIPLIPPTPAAPDVKPAAPRKYTHEDLENAYTEGRGQWSGKQLIALLLSVLASIGGTLGVPLVLDPGESSLPGPADVTPADIQAQVSAAVDSRLQEATRTAYAEGSEAGYLLALKQANSEGLVEPVPESLFQPGEPPTWRFKTRQQIATDLEHQHALEAANQDQLRTEAARAEAAAKKR